MKKKILAITLTAMMAVPILASTAGACSNGGRVEYGPIQYFHSKNTQTRNCCVTAWKKTFCTACGQDGAAVYYGFQYNHSIH